MPVCSIIKVVVSERERDVLAVSAIQSVVSENPHSAVISIMPDRIITRHTYCKPAGWPNALLYMHLACCVWRKYSRCIFTRWNYRTRYRLSAGQNPNQLSLGCCSRSSSCPKAKRSDQIHVKLLRANRIAGCVILQGHTTQSNWSWLERGNQINQAVRQTVYG